MAGRRKPGKAQDLDKLADVVRRAPPVVPPHDAEFQANWQSWLDATFG